MADHKLASRLTAFLTFLQTHRLWVFATSLASGAIFFVGQYVSTAPGEYAHHLRVAIRAQASIDEGERQDLVFQFTKDAAQATRDVFAFYTTHFGGKPLREPLDDETVLQGLRLSASAEEQVSTRQAPWKSFGSWTRRRIKSESKLPKRCLPSAKYSASSNRSS